MTLSKDWSLDSINSAHFQDEAKEADEADEADEDKDGWGWVEGYGLQQSKTSNSKLHQLARAVRGIEKGKGRQFAPEQLRAIFDKWEACSRVFLRAEVDYYIEFLARLNRVKVPLGGTLQAAFDIAQKKEPPSGAATIRNKGLRVFASLCRELSEMGKGQPVMLHQKSIGELFGHTSHRTISDWIAALSSLGVLRLVEPMIPKVKAARYLYLE